MLPNPVHMDALVRLKQTRWLHEAERDRLVRLARAARGKRALLSVRALAWLGQHLILWGQNLQRRVGLEIDARVLAAESHCQPC